VISIVSDAFTWTPGDAWWDVGVPEVSEKEAVRAVRKEQEQGRRKQRIGV
jgi:3D-(3,5/4)-trihydroxycyclohexane-1,2-dione acylhydrolase (decyclizing)